MGKLRPLLTTLACGVEDLKRTRHGEHVRRWSDVTDILMSTSMIVITAAVSIAETELDLMQATAGRKRACQP